MDLVFLSVLLKNIETFMKDFQKDLCCFSQGLLFQKTLCNPSQFAFIKPPFLNLLKYACSLQWHTYSHYNAIPEKTNLYKKFHG